MSDTRNVVGDQMQVRLEKLTEQWSQGQVSLKQIMGLSNDELYAISTQGYNFFLQGKIQPARVIFEGLVAIEPRNAYYYRALGVIYWREKEPQKALKQFTYAIRVAPNEIASHINRAEVLVANKQFDDARSDLQYALKHAQAHDGALVRKARAILQMIQ
tara:strand:+ start:53 stop:529 length:477 start_codon:yes stop_codon:yes gene_type:complete